MVVVAKLCGACGGEGRAVSCGKGNGGEGSWWCGESDCLCNFTCIHGNTQLVAIKVTSRVKVVVVVTVVATAALAVSAAE